MPTLGARVRHETMGLALLLVLPLTAQNSSSPQSPPPLYEVSTHLVQFGVIARNKDGLADQYQTYSQSGVQFRGVITLKPGATMLRVLVQDAATAEVGCVIVPLEKVQ